MDASKVLLERLIATKGLAVRSSSKHDIYWYTSSIPGPFYFNTQNIAGEHAAGHILEKITNILKDTTARDLQTKAIAAIINQAVMEDPLYRASIDALVDYYRSQSNNVPSMRANP
ncbi:hypothetical protein [Paenibacillus spongiae]|uniref:Insulinase family protein n=1 Tax=Paenibacillus spongiae TaxID=2909671 RepID=A0ABY5SGM6_9BACL|nr:hypothetical protein [Paenibacillus spongiae]UVI33157.1 hypothetical protein L1F29_15525 [Paenibacillus spongiae]